MSVVIKLEHKCPCSAFTSMQGQAGNQVCSPRDHSRLACAMLVFRCLYGDRSVHAILWHLELARCTGGSRGCSLVTNAHACITPLLLVA
jgi:hypothetical protein